MQAIRAHTGLTLLNNKSHHGRSGCNCDDRAEGGWAGVAHDGTAGTHGRARFRSPRGEGYPHSHP